MHVDTMQDNQMDLYNCLQNNMRTRFRRIFIRAAQILLSANTIFQHSIYFLVYTGCQDQRLGGLRALIRERRSGAWHGLSFTSIPTPEKYRRRIFPFHRPNQTRMTTFNARLAFTSNVCSLPGSVKVQYVCVVRVLVSSRHASWRHIKLLILSNRMCATDVWIRRAWCLKRLIASNLCDPWFWRLKRDVNNISVHMVSL